MCKPNPKILILINQSWNCIFKCHELTLGKTVKYMGWELIILIGFEHLLVERLDEFYGEFVRVVF